jgi:hypothetical protein
LRHSPEWVATWRCSIQRADRAGATIADYHGHRIDVDRGDSGHRHDLLVCLALPRLQYQGNLYPDWAHSNKIEFVVWTIPCIIILILGTITWRSTHALDPRQPIASPAKPLVIEAISLDWKWLFIYPSRDCDWSMKSRFP